MARNWKQKPTFDSEGNRQVAGGARSFHFQRRARAGDPDVRRLDESEARKLAAMLWRIGCEMGHWGSKRQKAEAREWDEPVRMS